MLRVLRFLNNRIFVKQKGFTLVELMVVISIIAVLSAVGLVIFGNAQVNARNSRRISDINAIANELESHKTSSFTISSTCSTPYSYCPLQTAWFSNNTLPSDPQGGSYCISATTSVTNSFPTYNQMSSGCSAGTSGYAPISTAIPAGTKSWQLCASLEPWPSRSFAACTTSTCYCISNRL